MRDQLREQLQAIAEAELDWEGSLEDQQDLVEVFELDSLRQLSLIVAIEDHFEILLEEGVEAELKTVGDLLSLIERTL